MHIICSIFGTYFYVLAIFGLEKCVICEKFENATKQHKFWSKMFPSHPKCSLGFSTLEIGIGRPDIERCLKTF